MNTLLKHNKDFEPGNFTTNYSASATNLKDCPTKLKPEDKYGNHKIEFKWDYKNHFGDKQIYKKPTLKESKDSKKVKPSQEN